MVWQKSESQNLWAMRISLEIDPADRDEKFEIRQMVAYMGRAIQSKQMCPW